MKTNLAEECQKEKIRMKKLAFIFVLIMTALCALYLMLNPSPDEFAEGDLYDEIISRGKIRVGINTDSKPFGFIDEKGQIAGVRQRQTG